MMEKFPDKYPNVRVLAKRFGYGEDHVQVVHLINHYEAVEQLKGAVPSNMVTRVTMLPERIVREVRRAPSQLMPNIITRVIMLPEELVPEMLKLPLSRSCL
jgi:hypothetical protein